ncbi:hypothetical protein EPUL_004548 [Erysiphe pulchra]|uniref:Uncharacterized protein n=1 Tax=Erysiphe pulchra TaxID=225359 RepID=A0A2S4PPR7_9PEZI|nr:hypothetical protein EPUL_004548 [Erysiphe pulchra]
MTQQSQNQKMLADVQDASELYSTLSELEESVLISNEEYNFYKTAGRQIRSVIAEIRLHTYTILRSKIMRPVDLIENFFMDQLENELCTAVRTSKRGLINLWNEIKNHPVFQNNLVCRQRHSLLQLAVALERFGSYGNGASLGRIARTYGIGQGTAIVYTKQVITAVRELRDQYLAWPDANRISNEEEEEEDSSGCSSESNSEFDSSSYEDEVKGRVAAESDKRKKQVLKRSRGIESGEEYFSWLVTFDHLSSLMAEIYFEEKSPNSYRQGRGDRRDVCHNYACSLGVAEPQVMSAHASDEGNQSNRHNQRNTDKIINSSPSPRYPKIRRPEKRVLSAHAQGKIDDWFNGTGIKLGFLEPHQAARVKRLVYTYQDLNSLELNELPLTDLYIHRVRLTKGTVPWNKPKQR